jgi:hypothetical protein
MMDTTKQDIPQDIASAIAAAVHEGIHRSIPLEIQLWTAEHIAEYLNRNIAQTRQAILCLPDFPKPFRLPVVNSTKRGHPLYKASEVIEWVEKYRERDALAKQRRQRRSTIA